jgi:uncharacterized peroxidase-related enzyme
MMTHAVLPTLPLLDENSALPIAAEQLVAAKKAMGFVPNMYGYMANLPALFSTYNAGYAVFRNDAGFSSVEQEVVFLAISRANGCDYCTAAHSMVADKMSGVPADVLQNLRSGTSISDPRLDALARFAFGMTETRGKVDPSLMDDFLSAGFTQEHVLAVVLAISVKTLSNYTNHLAETPVDAAFSDYAV